MNFPSIGEVQRADREQLCRWWRFLPVAEGRSKVINLIGDRLHSLGGFNARISKKIGLLKEKQ